MVDGALVVVDALDAQGNSTHGLIKNLKGATELCVHGVIVGVEASFAYTRAQSANVPKIFRVWVLVVVRVRYGEPVVFGAGPCHVLDIPRL